MRSWNKLFWKRGNILAFLVVLFTVFIVSATAQVHIRENATIAPVQPMKVQAAGIRQVYSGNNLVIVTLTSPPAGTYSFQP